MYDWTAGSVAPDAGRSLALLVDFRLGDHGGCAAIYGTDNISPVSERD
jgi:hypothetical protein